MKPVHYDIHGAWDNVMQYHSLACGRNAPHGANGWRHSRDPAKVTCKACRKSDAYRRWERQRARSGQ